MMVAVPAFARFVKFINIFLESALSRLQAYKFSPDAYCRYNIGNLRRFFSRLPVFIR